jgi:hypothetical protein
MSSTFKLLEAHSWTNIFICSSVVETSTFLHFALDKPPFIKPCNLLFWSYVHRIQAIFLFMLLDFQLVFGKWFCCDILTTSANVGMKVWFWCVWLCASLSWGTMSKIHKDWGSNLCYFDIKKMPSMNPGIHSSMKDLTIKLSKW